MAILTSHIHLIVYDILLCPLLLWRLLFQPLPFMFCYCVAVFASVAVLLCCPVISVMAFWSYCFQNDNPGTCPVSLL